jgi:tight adherence protein B
MDPLVLILIIGGGFVFLLLIGGVVVTARSERSLVEERLGQYLEDEKETKAQQKKREKESPVGEWLNRRLERSSWGEGLGKELARADLKLKPGEYVATMLISAVGTGFVFWYFMNRGSSIPFFTIIGIVVGLFLRIYVRRQQAKRLMHFNDQLADMLNLMVNGLRAGYSICKPEAVSRRCPRRSMMNSVAWYRRCNWVSR